MGQHSCSHRLNESQSAAAERATILRRGEVLVKEQPKPGSDLFLILLGVARALEDLHNPYCTLSS